MARTFATASSSRIRQNIGAMSTFTYGYHIAVLRVSASSAFNEIIAITGDTAGRGTLDLNNSGVMRFNLGGSNISSTFTVTSADGWVLVAAGKDTGTTAVTMHKYVFSTNAWTHETKGNLADNAGVALGANPRVVLGDFNGTGGNPFNGDIAAIASVRRKLQQAEIEQLPFSLTAWYALGPLGMWVLDQADIAQSVIDLTGNGADQISTVGTSVADSSVPILGYGDSPALVLDAIPWDGELANTGGGQADETAVTTGNSTAGGDPWNAVTVSVGGEVTFDDVNGSTWHRFATAATSGQSRVEWTSASITAPMARIYGGFWFRIPSAALGGTLYLMRARAAGVQTTRISVSSGNKLQIRNTSNAAAEQGAVNIAADTDYFVRYDVTTGASAAGTVELYNATGTLLETLSPTATNFGTGSVDEVGYGIASNVSSQSPYLIRGMASSVNAWPSPPSPPPGATPSGLAVPATLGSPTVATTLTTAPSGLAVPVAVGTPTTAIPTSMPSGIAVAVALGSPSTAILGATPAGVAVPVALGSPTVPSADLIPAGIAVPVTPGSPATALNRSAVPSGAVVSVAVGTPSAAVHGASPAGIAVPVATGSPGASVLIQPNGISVPLSLGVPSIALNRSAAPTGLGIPVAVGAPASAYGLATAPAGLAVAVAAGTPTVGHLGATPAGIALTLALGPPATAYAASVGPDGISVPVAVGSPRVNNVRPTVPRPGGGSVGRPGAGTVERPFAGFVTR